MPSVSEAAGHDDPGGSARRQESDRLAAAIRRPTRPRMMEIADQGGLSAAPNVVSLPVLISRIVSFSDPPDPEMTRSRFR